MVERLRAHDAVAGADRLVAFDLALARERSDRVAEFLSRASATPHAGNRVILPMPPRTGER
jgi:hypothetical protein